MKEKITVVMTAQIISVDFNIFSSLEYFSYYYIIVFRQCKQKNAFHLNFFSTALMCLHFAKAIQSQEKP